MAVRDEPPRWRNLTIAEKHAVCNGCGGKGGWFDPPDYLFTASCDQHDFNYWLGGSEEDRSRADRQFRDAMLRDAGTATRWWRRLWLRGAAWRYYLAVRAFGRKFFNYRSRPATWEDLRRFMES